MNNTDGLLLALTCVSMMWNMSAPLPDSRLGILISTVEPRSLLGPLFMAWNHIRRRKTMTGPNERSVYKRTESFVNGLYLEGQIERLEVALHLFQLDEARGVDGVAVHEGGWRHHTAATVIGKIFS